MLAIPPFNYPVNLAVSKIAPALMAGNTIVLKPPTQVRLCYNKLAQMERGAKLFGTNEDH